MSKIQLLEPAFIGNFFSKFNFMDSLLQKTLFKKLQAIRWGYLEIKTPQGEIHAFGNPEDKSVCASLVEFKNPIALRKIAFGGSVGTGESFIERHWECSSLSNLTRIFVHNRDALEALDGGMGAIVAHFMKLIHLTRKNHVQNAEKNIQAHYDLGNDFFDLFLDSSRMYSAGIFVESDGKVTTLEHAQLSKNERICNKLNVKASDHILEIGSGWGGFAIYAAQKYGCKITTVTISRKQYEFAIQQIKTLGLERQIDIRFQDYRKIEGKYDHVVSIEMIEAVGLNYLDSYFNKISSILKEDGQALVQSILIREQYFKSAAKQVDFIQTYVFPGSAIPSIRRILDAIESDTDLKLEGLFDFGEDYARTLAEWDRRLTENYEKLLKIGYSDKLYRLWKYYFAYCIGGFQERAISVAQLHFTKPRFRSRPLNRGAS